MSATSTLPPAASTARNYVQDQLPPSVVEKLEAGAFRSLCDHLKERSDAVQNIDLMTVSGFCRNCLAKWMVVEARRLADALRSDENATAQDKANELQQILKSLDAMGYDQAAQYVYGMDYGDWKKAHSKKASDDQMLKFNDSKHLWAGIDKDTLKTRSDAPGARVVPMMDQNGSAGSSTLDASSLLSNVCCQDVDTANVVPAACPAPAPKKPPATRQLPPYSPPEPPADGVTFSLGILTVSDRASEGKYESGDLSGPAVKEAVESVVRSMEKVLMTGMRTSIVPDDVASIQNELKRWSDGDETVDLILTTGGTGFALRDVTPEATKSAVDVECSGLMAFCALESAKIQRLATLSRGTAGVRNKTLIANLPGNPKAVGEIMPLLLPLALHAIADMQR